jgi:hypothetical protein
MKEKQVIEVIIIRNQLTNRTHNEIEILFQKLKSNIQKLI